MYFSSILLYLTHKATSLNSEDTIMFYTLSSCSYAQNEGVLDGNVIGIYSSYEKAKAEMIANVDETAGMYDDDDHSNETEYGDYTCTFKTKDGYLIDYTIQEFDTIQ